MCISSSDQLLPNSRDLYTGSDQLLRIEQLLKARFTGRNQERVLTMRLLRTGPLLPTGPYKRGQEKFDLIEKSGSNIPKYAILSHTWGIDEVTYEHVRNPTAFERRVYSNTSKAPYEHVRDQSVRKRKGYNKIVGAMRQAAIDGHQYIWIDSCCIDKSNSSELSEAINSMYAWYQKAEVCYAILDDVPAPDAANFEAKFTTSRWFQRGWTLQELLAPNQMVFYGRSLGSWILLGDRVSLQGQISMCTGISADYLKGAQNLHTASIAQKMSWAAGRKTTKEEDIAYCLLGLPLLYGEGTRAFMRLQEEIMKISDDQTIFAWMQGPTKQAICDFEPVDFASLRTHERREVSIEGPEPETMISWVDSSHGLLAHNPGAFSRSGGVVRCGHFEGKVVPYEMTNRGLSVSLHLMPLSDNHWENLFVAGIECCREIPVGDEANDIEGEPICIYIKRTSTSPGSNQYTRLRCEKLATFPIFHSWTPENAPLTRILVRQTNFTKEATESEVGEGQGLRTLL
jgi:hypothetical protein